MSLLEGLTEAQKTAVQHTAGPLMIVAGAGTGKTTVLTKRILYLLASGVAPREIMAVTFTEKAASEIIARIESVNPEAALSLQIGTFHSICERILREFGHHIGLPIGFQVLSESGAWMFMRNRLAAFDLSYFAQKGNATRFIRAILSHISRCKDELIAPEQYLEYATARKLNADSDVGMAASADTELAQLYVQYEKEMLHANKVDFGSLLFYTHELLRSRPNILALLRARLRHVLVDEFQDTNRAQYEIVRLLCAGEGPVLTVVGDDNQSIYGFRGAVMENILDFKNDFPTATSVVLNENFRTKQNILDMSYALIGRNAPHTLESRLGISKELHAAREGMGVIKYTILETEHDEATTIALELARQHEQGTPWNDMAILVRAHGHGEAIREQCLRRGVPIVVHGRGGTLQHRVAQQCIQVLRALHNAHDSVSLYGLLTLPPLALSHDACTQLLAASQKNGVSLFTSLKNAQLLPLHAEEQSRIALFLSALATAHALLRDRPIHEVLVHYFEVSGLLHYWQEQLTAGELDEPFVALQTFLEFVTQFVQSHATPTIDAFLQFYTDALISGDETGEQEVSTAVDAVHLMSVHAAKGLEFAHVFLPSMVHLRFPGADRGEALPLPTALLARGAEDADAHVREERRLCYVAITRARDAIHITRAKQYGDGKSERKPSRFIAEMELEQRVTGSDVTVLPVAPSVAVLETPTVPNPFTRLSFSQLQTFLRCPLQYKYRYVIKIPTAGSHAMSFGTTMHSTLQKWYEQLRQARERVQQDLFGVPSTETVTPTLEQLLELYRECWVDEWYESPEQKEEYFKNGQAILREFFARYAPFATVPRSLEQSFSVHIGGCTFAGRIDRIDEADGGGSIIIDYKTGKPKTRLEKEDKNQLLLYYAAIERDPKFADARPVQSLQYWYLNDLSVQEVPVNHDVLLTFEEEIGAVVSEMRASDFPAKPSTFVCTTCDFRSICPYRKLS